MGNNKSKENEVTDLLETHTDHTDSINCICVADDESVIVTGSEDKTARLWTTKDPKGSECLGTLKGHSGYVTCVHVFDTYVFTGSSDSTIKKWNMTSSECEFTYEGHASRVMRVICTGEYVISSSRDSTAKVWLYDTDDLPEGKKAKACIRTFKGHKKTVHPLIYISADESKGEEDLVITGSTDSTAKLWTLDSGTCLKTYANHKGPVMVMTTDNSGRILFTGSADTTIISWDIATAKQLKVYESHNTEIMCLSVVNKLMYSGDCAGLVKCWVWSMGDITREYRGHKHSVTCLKFYKGILYTGCGDGDVRGFEAKTSALVKTLTTKDSTQVINCMAICNDKLFSCSQDGKMRIWDISKISKIKENETDANKVTEKQENDIKQEETAEDNNFLKNVAEDVQ